MPGAIQVFARALNMSEQELFKQMELGKLYAKDVLPLVAKEMKNVANSGGALEEKYKTTRVAQGRFFNQLELAQNKIFKSGFDEGVAGLFNNLTTSFADNQGVLEELGKIYQIIFNTISAIIKGITPIVAGFVRALGTLGRTLEWLAERPLATTVVALSGVALGFTKLLGMRAAIAGFGLLLQRVFMAPLTIVLGIVAALDEFRAFFDADVVGIFDSMDDSYEKAKYEAARRRKFAGLSMKGDEQIISNYERTQLSENQRVDLAARKNMLGGSLNQIEQQRVQQREFEVLREQNVDGLLGKALVRISALTGNEQAKAVLSGESAPRVVNQTISITVDGSKDPSATAKAVKQELSNLQPAYGGR